MPDDRNWYAELTRETGNRSLAIVPLVRQGRHLGNFHLARREVRPFTSAQATILQAFADQAVIAVTNAGLFNDLAEVARPTGGDDGAARRGQHRAHRPDPGVRRPRAPGRSSLRRHRRAGGDASKRWTRRHGQRRIPSGSVSGPGGDADRRQHLFGAARAIAKSSTSATTTTSRRIATRTPRAGGPAPRAPSPSPWSATTSRWASSRSPVLPRGIQRCRGVAAEDLRRPGGGGRRQRPPAHRDRAAQHRAGRVARAADGDQRGPRSSSAPTPATCARCSTASSPRRPVCATPTMPESLGIEGDELVLHGDEPRDRRTNVGRPGVDSTRRGLVDSASASSTIWPAVLPDIPADIRSCCWSRLGRRRPALSES